MRKLIARPNFALACCWKYKAADVFNEEAEGQHPYDTADYRTNHFLHTIVSKKVLSTRKDEWAWRTENEYVGVSPKMHNII